MFDFLSHLFDSAGFLPHGHCYLWDPNLVRLHLLTDLAIGVSYVAISLTLVYLVRRARSDVPFSWMLVCFGTFIIACGGTHFMEIWTLWTPVYWFSGAVKFATAAASVLTATMLPPLVPKVLTLIRSAKLSESAMAALQREIAERRRQDDEIRRLNADLEERVNARTAQLAEANQSLARLAAIVACSNDAIVSLDLDSAITSWNPAAERLYGYRAEEIQGRPVSALAPADLSGELAEMIQRVKRDEHIGSFDSIRVRKTGQRFNVHATLSAIKDHAGRTLGVSMISRDVTERERSQDMLRLTVEAAPNAMIMADSQGKMVLVNSQTERLFGYSRQELLGRQVDVLVPAQYRSQHPQYRAQFIDNPRARAMGAGRGLYGLRKDGSEFPVEIVLNPIATDRGIWVLSAIVDITERKRAQQEIQRLNEDLERRVIERTKELTAANTELEAFCYTVSHDLRAPLRQIAGFSKILAEECGSTLPPEALRHLQKIKDGAQQMGVLIDDLLNLARIGRHQLTRRPASLDQLVQAAIAELHPDQRGREIEWRLEDLGTVECDPGLIKQVFVNLLSNAIKYTRGRAPAVIQVGQTMLDGKKVMFIRDNGAGFDMQYAGKLFGVFQRLHKAKDFEGTGVGLAIVQRIIHKHGGRIWAEAEPDRGATFSFTIPGGKS